MNNKLIAVLGIIAAFGISCAHKKKDIEVPQAKKAEAVETKVQQEKPMMAYTCLVQKDIRIVELDKKDQRCEVHYTKHGEKAQVAWAENTPSICSDVYAKIRNNIEEKGFKCTSQLDNEENKARKSASLNK